MIFASASAAALCAEALSAADSDERPPLKRRGASRFRLLHRRHDESTLTRVDECDQCITCGAAVSSWGLHLRWHDAQTTFHQGLHAEGLRLRAEVDRLSRSTDEQEPPRD